MEKAIGNAWRAHPGEPRSALVIGAGAVGLLCAMALRLRGVDVTVCSLEATDSRRAQLAEEAGARYVNRPDRAFDVVVEAAGSVEAVSAGLEALGAAGVLIVLGATKPLTVPMLPLILKNQAVIGSVNAAASTAI